MKDFKIFLEVAKNLNNKFKITPILFGSVGLYKLINYPGKNNDIDILIPNTFINHRWNKLVRLMEYLKFKLINQKEHEFIRRGKIVAFGKQNDLKELAKINPLTLENVNHQGIKFKELNLGQYLIIYQLMKRDGYRKYKKGNQDQKKIKLIKDSLKDQKKRLKNIKNSLP